MSGEEQNYVREGKDTLDADVETSLHAVFRGPVGAALEEAATKVRKFPNLSPAETILKHVALHLRANNKKEMLKHNREEREKQLRKFTMGCDLNEQLILLNKGSGQTNKEEDVDQRKKQFDELLQTGKHLHTRKTSSLALPLRP